MPLEIVERIGRVIFIYTMATNWAAFSAVVYHVVTEMPDAIGSSIMSATGATPFLTSAFAPDLEFDLLPELLHDAAKTSVNRNNSNAIFFIL